MVTGFYSDSGDREDAYGLLGFAVRKLYGAPCPEIAKTPEGKPYFPSRPDIFFSLSHTRGRVMVVVGDCPCGCDTQVLRPVRDNVVRRVCGEEELAELDFFSLWSLKESCIKLAGRFVPYLDMPFRMENGVIRTPAPELRARLYPAPTHASAICALCDPPETLIFVPRKNLTGSINK